jgi:outer membrane protein
MWFDAVPLAHPLRLDDAIAMGLRAHPSIKQAHAQTNAAEARADEAKASYLPQLTAVASYQRVRRANFAGTGIVNTAGTAGAGTGGGAATGTTGGPTVGTTAGGAPSTITSVTEPGGVNVFTFGGSGSQLIYDFGHTPDSYRAANRLALALEAQEKVTAQVVIVNVRRAYFLARTQKALAVVARTSLINLERHLFQITEFVSAGTRPEIDLAQARTDVANGRAALINAENAYGLAKAQLAQAMGDFSGTDYDVVDEEMPPIDGEDLPPETLVAKAMSARPEIVVLGRRVEAQNKTLTSTRATYYPVLAANGGASETGTSLSSLGPAWNIGVNLTWPVFEGGLVKAQVREAEANVAVAEGDLQIERLQIRVDVTQAALNVRAAKSALTAAEDAAESAREQLRLAEGRYTSGLGNAIELGDAQLAFTTAESNLAQARYRLWSARADLLYSLGRR